jgi:predicted outer membrane repeat protein
VYEGSANIFSSTFESNWAQKKGGGAIEIMFGAVSIVDTVFSANVVYGGSGGGAIYVKSLGAFDASVTIRHCSFIGPISEGQNDIARIDGRPGKAVVTFACQAGSAGNPVVVSFPLHQFESQRLTFSLLVSFAMFTRTRSNSLPQSPT